MNKRQKRKAINRTFDLGYFFLDSYYDGENSYYRALPVGSKETSDFGNCYFFERLQLSRLVIRSAIIDNNLIRSRVAYKQRSLLNK